MMIGVIGVTSVVYAAATSSTVGATPPPTCRFHVGGPIVEGAAGSGLIVVPIVPDSPWQSCTTTFSATAGITGSYGRPYNLEDNPITSTITVTFRPSELPPYVTWEWSPHCADPASLPLTFSVSSPSGGSSQVPLTPESCSDVGSGVVSEIRMPVTSSPNPSSVTGIAPVTNDTGYRTVTIDGLLYPYGKAGSVEGPAGNAPVVGIANAGGTADGSWCVAADGGVFALGGAPFYGSMGGKQLNAPIVGMAATPDSHGYWLVAADGGVFGFGDATFRGSIGGLPLDAPVVGMAAPATGGYRLVAADGGIFSFGGAPFLGSMGGHTLNAPIAGMADSVDGRGYWLVGADGGVFAFGNAPFLGPSSYPGAPS